MVAKVLSIPRAMLNKPAQMTRLDRSASIRSKQVTKRPCCGPSGLFCGSIGPPAALMGTPPLCPQPLSAQVAQDGAHATVQRSVEHAVRPLARYRCAACGFEAQGYFWQCPGCQAWESFPPRRIEEL